MARGDRQRKNRERTAEERERDRLERERRRAEREGRPFAEPDGFPNASGTPGPLDDVAIAGALNEPGLEGAVESHDSLEQLPVEDLALEPVPEVGVAGDSEQLAEPPPPDPSDLSRTGDTDPSGQGLEPAVGSGVPLPLDPLSAHEGAVPTVSAGAAGSTSSGFEVAGTPGPVSAPEVSRALEAADGPPDALPGPGTLDAPETLQAPGPPEAFDMPEAADTLEAQDTPGAFEPDHVAEPADAGEPEGAPESAGTPATPPAPEPAVPRETPPPPEPGQAPTPPASVLPPAPDASWGPALVPAAAGPPPFDAAPGSSEGERAAGQPQPAPDATPGPPAGSPDVPQPPAPGARARRTPSTGSGGGVGPPPGVPGGETVPPRRGPSPGTRVVAVVALLIAAAVVFVLVRSLRHTHHAKPPPAPAVVHVLIPEGVTRLQIAEIAKRDGLAGSYRVASRRSSLLSPQEYGAPATTKTLEGFLFPATYDEYPRAPVDRLVADQLTAFKENLPTDIVARAKALHLSVYEVLIVASMVEREARLAADRSKVAAVIYNRLRIGMPLAVDATLYYAIELQKDVPTYTAELTESQLRMNSAYNTRIRKGLPPTPISNPGLAAIQAAAHPAAVPYLYYVNGADGCGELAFSTSAARFQADVAAYQAALAANHGHPPRCKGHSR